MYSWRAPRHGERRRSLLTLPRLCEPRGLSSQTFALALIPSKSRSDTRWRLESSARSPRSYSWQSSRVKRNVRKNAEKNASTEEYVEISIVQSSILSFCPGKPVPRVIPLRDSSSDGLMPRLTRPIVGPINSGWDGLAPVEVDSRAKSRWTRTGHPNVATRQRSCCGVGDTVSWKPRMLGCSSCVGAC